MGSEREDPELNPPEGAGPPAEPESGEQPAFGQEPSSHSSPFPPVLLTRLEDEADNPPRPALGPRPPARGSRRAPEPGPASPRPVPTGSYPGSPVRPGPGTPIGGPPRPPVSAAPAGGGGGGRNNTTLWLVLASVVVLLVVVALGGFLLLRGKSDDPTVATTPSPQHGGSGSPAPSGSGSRLSPSAGSGKPSPARSVESTPSTGNDQDLCAAYDGADQIAVVDCREKGAMKVLRQLAEGKEDGCPARTYQAVDVVIDGDQSQVWCLGKPRK